MTEITKINEIDYTALILAGVGGPLLVGFFGIPLFLIPVFAMVVGGPIYLIVGLPVMMLVLRRHEASPGLFSLTAFIAFAALAIMTVAGLSLTGTSTDGIEVLIIAGAIFAPIWGQTSGWLYLRWRKRPISHDIFA